MGTVMTVTIQTGLLKFSKVPKLADKHERLYSLFSERFKYYDCHNAPSDFISFDLVQNVVRDLKRGKAAGCDGLIAEHICLAHPLLLVHLSCLFTMLMILAEESLYLYLRMWTVTGSQQTIIVLYCIVLYCIV